MAFDSLTLASAAALFAATVWAWRLCAPFRSIVRIQLRFAAILLAALAVCAVLHLADVAALFLLPLAGTCMALAALARFARPLPAFLVSLALVLALGFGLGATLSGQIMLSLVPVVIAALAIVASALHGLAVMPVLAGIALLAAPLAFLQAGAGPGVMLFCAAALAGLVRPQSVRSSSNAVRGAGLP